jgi:hypothetical protein
MTQPLTCRSCGKPRGVNARAENALCRSCSGKQQGRKRGKAYKFTSETVADRAVRMPTSSWWLEPGANYKAAAKRMAGNGWEV